MKHPKLLSNHLVIQRFSWVLFTVTVFITSQIMSQTANNQYRTINSKTAPPETFKFISPKTCLVEVPGATWIQIIFGRYNLNKSGTVTIYNEDNGESQTFNQNQLDSWNGMSALFNSSRLRISASTLY